MSNNSTYTSSANLDEIDQFLKKHKLQFTHYEIFANYISDKGLISKTYKAFIQLNNNNKNQSY